MVLFYAGNKGRRAHSAKLRKSGKRHRDAGGRRRKLVYEALEDRRLLAVLYGDGSFEDGSDHPHAAGWIGPGPEIPVRVTSLHHENAGTMGPVPNTGAWFGAITIPREDTEATPMTVMRSSLYFTASAGERLTGNFFLMVGANAVGGNDYAEVQVFSAEDPTSHPRSIWGDLVEKAKELKSSVNTWTIGFRKTPPDHNGINSGWVEFDEWEAPATGSYILEVEVGRQARQAGNANYRVSIGLDHIQLHDEDTTPPSISFSGDVDQSDGQNNIVSWAISDPSGISSRTVILRRSNGAEVLANSTNNNGSFNLNSIAPGDYRLEATATDADAGGPGDMSTTSVIGPWFTIFDDDTTNPTISLGGSSGTQSDGLEQQFTWSISDASGIAQRQIVITHNNVEIFRNTTLNSGSFNFDSYGLGQFAMVVTAVDNDTDWGTGDRRSNTLTRIVHVTDDDTAAPVITLDGSSGTETDAQPQQFTWSISDSSGIAARLVTVTRNGGTIYTNTTSNSGSFNFDGFGLGTYVISVSVTDNDTDWGTGDRRSSGPASRSVTVIDDDVLAPTIDLGGSGGTQTDDQLQAFTWNISDASGIADRLVTVTRNGSLIFSQNSSNSGTFNFDSYGPGSYVMSVSATDADTDWGVGDRTSSAPVTRSVTVNDDDSAGPEITIGNGSLSDGEDNFFHWSVTDPSGISALSVKISKDGTGEIYASSLPDGQFDLNPYGSGTYTIEVDATDNDSDHADDKARTVRQRTIVIADDDTTAPTIDITSGSNSDGENNFFEWNVTDTSGVFDADVRITRDGTELYSNTYAPTGTFDLNPHGIGTFKIEIDATDDDNDAPGDRLSASTTHSTPISDDDTDPPMITVGGSTGSESHGLTQEFTWSITDDSGLQAAAIEVRKDGAMIFSSTDASGSFNFDSHGLGSYELVVSATDADNDWSGDTLSSEETRRVVVTNATPEAANDEANTDEDTPTTIDVVANDSDDDPNEELSVTDVDATGTLGFVTLNVDGTITYDPQGAFQHLAAGEQTTDSFSYTISDLFGGTATALVTVTIHGKNDKPVAAADVAGTTENASVDHDVIANDADVDATDMLSLAAVSASIASMTLDSDSSAIAVSTASVSQSGNSISFDPGTDFDFLATGETATVVIGYTVTDDDASPLTDSSTLTITVTGTNDGPVAMADGATTKEDMSVGGNVLANDTDVDATDQLTVVADNGDALGVGQPVATLHGTVTLNADGTFTYVPGGGSEATSDSFTYTISDGNGGTSTATVTITITQYAGVTYDGGILRVSGGDGVDVITVSGGNLIVNGVPYSLEGVTEVRIWGRGGDDSVDLSGLGIDSFVHGGDGNDSIVGGSARDIIFGGLGDDDITGAAGNDLLIGGHGMDRIVGSAGHDILVAGNVADSLTRDELLDILAEWVANRTPDAGLAEDVLDETLSDSGDRLTGASGADWFIIGDGDKITDWKKNNVDGDLVTVVS